MTIVRIDAAGSGVVSDIPAEELPLGIWSEAENVMFQDGAMSRALGMGTQFEPTFLPLWLAAFRTDSTKFLLTFGAAKVTCHDGSTETEIQKTGGYTGGSADRWTGGVLSGIFIASNGKDVPQYWAGVPATKMADLTGWSATKTCKFIRPFGNFLIAGNITTSGTATPYRVMWSDSADPGALPSTWTAASTNEAGDLDMAECGPLVDGCALGDVFIVYTTTGAHALRYIGGQAIMQRTQMPRIPGVMAANCVVDTPVGHAVFGPSDLYVHTGGSPQSICTATVRQKVFDTLDGDYATQACFVATNPVKSEVWFCYPEVGNSTCNKAAVWNWSTSAWTFRTLRNATCATNGQLPQWSQYTIDGVPGVFGDSLDLMFEPGSNPSAPRMAFGLASLAVAIVGSSFSDAGVSVTSTATRTGIHLNDPQRKKLLRSVWPRITGTAGTQISIQVGSHDRAGQTPTWGTAKTFTIGTDEKVDSMTSGRYLAVRVSSTAEDKWRLKAFDLDIQPLGLF